jgi:hypothetical protein
MQGWKIKGAKLRILAFWSKRRKKQPGGNYPV